MASAQADLSLALAIAARLECPRCAAQIDGLDCLMCGFSLDVRDDIVRALAPERATRFAAFMRDYEFIRAAEGRFSEGDEFYLALPYLDMTGRNSAQWKIRACSYDCLIRDVLQTGLPRGASILDIGAGNCWMSFRLALAGYRPVAVDLLANRRDGLAAAEHYRKRLPHLFPRFQAEMDRLPFRKEQFDAVIFNASFHYSENYESTLRSALRCLKKNGLVIVSDTPWYSREESGRQMLSERRAAFLERYGTSSDSIVSQEFLTDERLHTLEQKLAIRWKIFFPDYGLQWAMRPLLAKVRRRREPSRFRIYAAWKHA